MPILIRNASFKGIKASRRDDAITEAELKGPLPEASPEQHVYHQHAHPARRSGFPSIILNNYGKGQCIYIATEVFSSYTITGSPWVETIFLNCLDYIYKDQLIKVDTPASVQVYFMRQHGRYLLHLVNINDVKIDGKKVHTVPDMNELNFSPANNGIEFAIDNIDLHKTIVIE